MPGYDRTGPRAEGPMSGGRRGFCRGADYHISLSEAYGVGRGGRPWGGGRGRAWGSGYGKAKLVAGEVVAPVESYPFPSVPLVGWIGTIDSLLGRLSQLAASIADLHDRITSGNSAVRQGSNDEQAE